MNVKIALCAAFFGSVADVAAQLPALENNLVQKSTKGSVDLGVVTTRFMKEGDYDAMFEGVDKRRMIVSERNTKYRVGSPLVLDDGEDLKSHLHTWCSTTGGYSDTPVSEWDVSKVSVFVPFTIPLACRDFFNEDIGKWNTSAVTDMTQAFHSAYLFNQNLNEWNTAKVTTMRYAFGHAEAFNGNMDMWNTGSVSDVRGLFQDTPFNKPIGQWNTAKFSTLASMFYHTSFGDGGNFNQDLQAWNMANAVDLSGMFSRSKANMPLSDWNMANAVNLFAMFSSSKANMPLSDWNTSNVVSVDYTFQDASSFNQDISAWNTLRVTEFKRIFRGAASLSNCNKHLIWSAWPETFKTANYTFPGRRRRSYLNEEYISWSQYECEALAPALSDSVPLTLEENSLGTDGGRMRFNNVVEDGTQIVVENVTEYNAFRPEITGLTAPSSSLAQISLGCGDKVEMNFNFVLDSQPKSVPAFNLTVADLDRGTHDRCAEAVEVLGYTNYALYPDNESSSVLVDNSEGSLRFVGNAIGSSDDNPENIESMTEEQKKKAVKFFVQNRDSFTVIFSASEPGESSKDPDTVGYNGRRILFGFKTF